MTWYIVIRTGVYRHEIFGPFGTLGAAKIRAAEELRSEKDHYHTYEIMELDIGQDPKVVAEAGWEWEKRPFYGPPDDPRNTKGKGHLVWLNEITGRHYNGRP